MFAYSFCMYSILQQWKAHNKVQKKEFHLKWSLSHRQLLDVQNAPVRVEIVARTASLIAMLISNTDYCAVVIHMTLCLCCGPSQ